MTYRIRQDFAYVGNDYWRWWAWIEAATAQLDQVEKVVWILHPSFRRARVSVNDRSTGFRLDTAGWGTFLLRAEVVQQDGATHVLSHNLRLTYPSETTREATSSAAEMTKKKEPLTVFLSYGGQDSRAASKARESLEAAGVEVLDMSRLNAGEPWKEALERMISRSGLVVGLVGEEEISPFVIDELQAAAAAEKPSVALLPPGKSATELPNGIQTLRFDASPSGALPIADLLRSHNLI